MKTLTFGTLKISLDLDREEEETFTEAIRKDAEMAKRHHEFRRQA